LSADLDWHGRCRWYEPEKIIERGDPMHSDIWYDLAIRELSDLSDPAKGKLAEAAAETLAEPDVEEEAPADPRAVGAPAPEKPHRG
jgi:hypothetical protein